MKQRNYDENTFCQAYDERCNGCIYEKRWNQMIAMPIKDRAAKQETMNALEPADCANLEMAWKDT